MHSSRPIGMSRALLGSLACQLLVSLVWSSGSGGAAPYDHESFLVASAEPIQVSAPSEEADAARAAIRVGAGTLTGDWADSPDNKIHARVAEEEQSWRLAAYPTSQDPAQVLEEHYTQVLKPLILAAGESCAAAKRAAEAVASAARQAELLGAPIADTLGSELNDLALVNAEVCMREEYERCVDDHVVHGILIVYLSIVRQLSLMGFVGETGQSAGQQAAAQWDRQARQYVEQCLRFDLDLESTAVDGPPGDGFESRVRSTVPLRFRVDSGRYTGQAPLVNEFFEFRISDRRCSVTSTRGGGTFEFAQIAFLTEPSADPDDIVGRLRDLSVNYFPGRTSESFSYRCPDQTPVSVGPTGLWSGMFIIAHAREASAEGGFTATGWELLGGEYFARKEWQFEDRDLQVLEVGTFKLYHRPGN